MGQAYPTLFFLSSFENKSKMGWNRKQTKIERKELRRRCRTVLPQEESSLEEKEANVTERKGGQTVEKWTDWKSVASREKKGQRKGPHCPE